MPWALGCAPPWCRTVMGPGVKFWLHHCLTLCKFLLSDQHTETFWGLNIEICTEHLAQCLTNSKCFLSAITIDLYMLNPELLHEVLRIFTELHRNYKLKIFHISMLFVEKKTNITSPLCTVFHILVKYYKV